MNVDVKGRGHPGVAEDPEGQCQGMGDSDERAEEEQNHDGARDADADHIG